MQEYKHGSAPWRRPPCEASASVSSRLRQLLAPSRLAPGNTEGRYAPLKPEYKLSYHVP